MRELSPHLRNLFFDLDDLNKVSVKGLPALRDFLDGLAPVLNELDPFLANLNPIIQYLEFNKTTISDFLVGPSHGLAGAYEPVPGDPAPRHGLRQLTYLSPETLAIHPSRLNHQPRQRLPASRRPQQLERRPERHLPQLRLQEHRLLGRQPGSR